MTVSKAWMVWSTSASVGAREGEESNRGNGCIRFREVRREDDSLGKSNGMEFVPGFDWFRRGDSFIKIRGKRIVFWGV